MRWVHAVGAIDCAPSCRLYGRISSERSIRLQAGCVFTRLNAPRIELGNLLPDSVPAVEYTAGRNAASGVMERVLHDGDLQIAPGEVFAKHLVVRGTLRIGEGARMLGNVKAQKGIVLDHGAFAYGSLISAATLQHWASLPRAGAAHRRAHNHSQLQRDCGRCGSTFNRQRSAH